VQAALGAHTKAMVPLPIDMKFSRSLKHDAKTKYLLARRIFQGIISIWAIVLVVNGLSGDMKNQVQTLTVTNHTEDLIRVTFMKDRARVEEGESTVRTVFQYIAR